MRSLEGSNRVRLGVMGIVLSVLAVGVGQTFNSIPMLFAEPSYYGEFNDSAGINRGDKVRILGVNVGTVTSLDIDGNHVTVGFTLGKHTIGTQSRLAIRTDTILGMKVLEIEPRGGKPLAPNDILPLGQSTSTYQIYDAFFDVTKAAAGWDVDAVKQSLNLLSATINKTSPHLGAALQGITRFSDVFGKRDDQFKHLLADANRLAKVFGDRAGDVNKLLINAHQLLAAVDERGQATTLLLDRVTALSEQVRGLQRQPQPQRRVAGVAHRHRPAGQTQSRPRRAAGHRPQLRRRPVRGFGLGPILQGAGRQSPSRPTAATVRRCRIQEARHRSRTVLALGGATGRAVARSQRHAFPQRRAAARADATRGHPRPPRTRSSSWIAVFVYAAGGRGPSTR
jgi:virulence factor Mce-like protein